MKCVDPFVKAGEAFACGRCLPCRTVQSRVWFNRIMLEASCHDHNSVVTLTYEAASLPDTGEVQPEHLRNWLKRYRKRQLERYPWRRLRLYSCAEYGTRTQRPHYHVVLFGIPGCEYGRTGSVWCGDCSCVSCSDVADTWFLGATSIDTLSPRSAAYVAGYVTRKLQLVALPGKRLPFQRMSNRPGIGASAMWDAASMMLTYPRLGYPQMIGRYLRGLLSELSERELPPPSDQQALSLVRDFAWQNSISQREIFRQINEVYASRLHQREALKEKAL